MHLMYIGYLKEAAIFKEVCLAKTIAKSLLIDYQGIEQSFANSFKKFNRTKILF